MENETKILVWNLQRFSLNKFIQENQPGLSAQENAELALTRQLNDAYLFFIVTLMNPDIFVVIEVQSSQGFYGTPVDGVGASGLIKILTDLRVANPNWMLVPSLRLNSIVDLRRGGVLQSSYTEGIGVFYRSDRLEFIGPWIWPNGPVDNVWRAVAPGTPGVQPANYPDVWKDCLPAGNHFAGQYLFDDDDGRPIDFTETWHRQPWLTQFRELERNVNRTINLTSVHLTPRNVSAAKKAVRLMVEYVPDYWVIPENTVSIIAGDFNLNRNKDYVEGNLLRLTKTEAYEWVFGPGGNTMYKPVDESNPNDYLQNLLLDNAIVFYPAALAQTPRVGVIGEIATGQPAANGLPAVPKTMFRAPAELQAYLQAQGMTPEQIAQRFRAAPNFGHIGPSKGLSDHLPIFFTV